MQLNTTELAAIKSQADLRRACAVEHFGADGRLIRKWDEPVWFLARILDRFYYTDAHGRTFYTREELPRPVARVAPFRRL